MNRTILNSIFIILLFTCSCLGVENVRKIATWNMKWLGINSGNQLDPVENVQGYANYIIETQATLFALQEIGATHSFDEDPKCYYLDLIVEKLNESTTPEPEKWTYILDGRNKNQRLAFLYRQDMWDVSGTRSIYPGSSYQYIRRPFLATIKAKGSNAELVFNYINIHLKAFPDAESREKRELNLEQLAIWLETNTLDADVLIAGDTNIYYGESGIYQPLKDIDYHALYDGERTAIHDGRLSQRFDRFFCSPDLKKEVDSAKTKVGKKEAIDVIKDNDKEKILKFDEEFSDHYAVVLNIDVSKER